MAKFKGDKFHKPFEELMQERGFYMGRMISGSKSGYRNRYPDNVVFFNANIITTQGKRWWGDLDLTLDQEKLAEVSKIMGEPLYVLQEMDGRFGEEENPVKVLIKRAWYFIDEDGLKESQRKIDWDKQMNR